ncbi:hypothetical protein L0668_03295 [Paraglaciecola aquimarina]|uniref:DUF7133 domain-containing protein n=1 Tax=Paraglaciecola algarum TaxID=3050085 RepID=A0ABS9D3U9_9ALTE|nr:hypothetical protein [Paraglaciecola sp. G1-23]MCF2947117.1 hypothetical protein [Paraglaciecola sp. G1-23]
MNKITKALGLSLLLTSAVSSHAQQPPSHTYKPDGYSIVTIETPVDVRFHATGLDSTSTGEVYVATRFGDVWKLNGETWTKFAEGLHEPTGLLVDDDGSIVVAQKPEFTRLIDTDKDGQADEYIMLAGDWDFHDNYHEFTFGPVKDKQGNYYGTLNLSHGDPKAFSLGAMGSSGGYRGFAFKVTPNGEFSPFAWGLRSPAGLGTSPDGELFYTDNQGDWVPTSTFHLLQEGKFYGHPVSLAQRPGYTKQAITDTPVEVFDKMREKPVALIPHLEVANSPGNPAWDTSKGQFGPFAGQIFVGDQTQSNIFRVLLDKVNGVYQGAVINFMNGFQSGNIRNEFDLKGQLWVGQTARGWGAKGGKPFGLQKVVWDGTNPFELHGIKLTKTGFELSFTDKIDIKSVALDSFSVQQWNYKYSGNYGSPKMNLTPVKATKVSLSSDKRTVTINMPLIADKVVQIDFPGLRDQSGRSVGVEKVYYTLNQLIK